MRILVFCALIGVSFAALTYSRQGGQASLPAYQAAVPLAGGDYKTQISRRPSSRGHQIDYIPSAYRQSQRSFKPSHELRYNYQPQNYEPQNQAYNPVDDFQNGDRHHVYKPQKSYRPGGHRQQHDFKSPTPLQPEITYKPQQSYQGQEDLGPDTSNFQYQVPIYDARTYSNAAVKVNRFPGGATYQLNENAHGSDVKVNFETAPSGRQANKPHY